jgi:hypothetical protein
MYESQVRPEPIGRKLVERQSPKQHNSILDCYCRAIDSAAYFFKRNPAICSARVTAALCILTAAVGMVSGCGGVNYKNTTGTQSNGIALNHISCGTQSLTGAQSKTCTVSLSAPALSNTVVQLTSNSVALQVPSQVTVAVGQNSVDFNAVSSVVSKTITATITGSLHGVSKSFALTVYPLAATLNGVNCASQSLTGSSGTVCTLTLSSAANSATVVSLNTSSTALQIPPTVTIGSGSTSAQFNVTALAVSSTQNVTLTASTGGVTQSYALQILAAGTHRVQLSWNAPAGTSTAILGYRVYRALANTSGYALLTASIDTQTSFTDSGVVSGSTYDYIVTSVDASGMESTPSNATEVTIP